METLAHWFGPLHPPTTHFPIVCSTLALLALVVGRWKDIDWLLKSASALWILTFLTAIPSVLFGHLFAHHLGMEVDWTPLPPPEILKGQLRFHAILGSLAALFSTLALWAAVKSIKGRPWPFFLQLILGLVLAALFGVTGHEGGEMLYPEETPVETSPLPSTTLSTSGDLWSQVAGYRQTMVKMNVKTWNSRTHGHRWVNTYVSKEAAAAYKNSDDMPEGALVVKESFEDEGGQASQTPGPLYAMRKGKVSDSPRTGGWQYALSWAQPAPGNPENIQMPVTWLPGDSHLNSCVKCHSHFKAVDYLGGVPAGYENK